MLYITQRYYILRNVICQAVCYSPVLMESTIRVHNTHSGNGAQRDGCGCEARCHQLQGVCLRRTDENAADIAQHRTDHRRENAVICALPEEGFVQAGGAHADSALHPDLVDAGVDIAINGVDDIQNTDECNQHPAEHFDLGETLRHLRTVLAIGKPLRAGIISAPAVQPCFKGSGVCILFQRGTDFRIVLGHAQASTTLDIYAHAFDKNKRKAQEKLGKAIGL